MYLGVIADDITVASVGRRRALAAGPAALENARRWAREKAQGGHLLIHSTAASGEGELLFLREGRPHRVPAPAQVADLHAPARRSGGCECSS